MEPVVAPFKSSADAACISQATRDRGSGLPVLKNIQPPSISPDTLKAVMAREPGYDRLQLKILDCRHSFEFEGGHILGALNLNEPTSLDEFYADHESEGKNLVLLFHCEFSSSRAPQMYAHMRNMDRHRHMEVYPELAFPHMFLLHGGYNSFYYVHPELCEPRQYVQMLDPQHSEQLRIEKESLRRSWNKVRSREGALARRSICDTGCDRMSSAKSKAVRSLDV